MVTGDYTGTLMVSTQKRNLAINHSQVVSLNQYSQLWLWQKNWAEQCGTLWQTWLRNTQLKLAKSKRPEAAETGLTAICYFILSCICASCASRCFSSTLHFLNENRVTEVNQDWCDPGVKHWVSRNVTVIWLHLFTNTVTQYSSIFIFLKLIMLPKRGYVLHSWRPPQNSSIHPDVWKEEERRDCSRREGASGKRNGIAWILRTFKNYTDVWVPKETTSGLCLFINYIRWDNWKCSWLKTLLLLAASILTGI